MTVLDKLADLARQRVEASKRRLSMSAMRLEALGMPVGDFPFTAALAKDGLSFICECKKASPSTGLIAPEFP